MRLSIDNLSILDDITHDADGGPRVALELRGAKNSVVRIYYDNGGERIRLEWDRQHLLTPECSAKVLRALRDDPRLAALLVNVLDDESAENEALTPEAPDLAALSQVAPPPTLFLN